MRKFAISIFIVLTMLVFGSALSSSAGEYYYYNNRGHSIERHGGRDRGYRMNLITPSNPFDDELRYYYHKGDNERYHYSNDHGRYYYYERGYDDDDVEFKLDIL